MEGEKRPEKEEGMPHRLKDYQDQYEKLFRDCQIS